MTNNTALTIISLAMMLAFVVPFGIFLLTGKRIKTGKKMLALNIISFFAIVVGTVVFSATGGVIAEPVDAAAASDGMKYLAAALSTGLAAIGAGIAVAAASSAALGAISEDPSAMGKSLIFVALAEGIALYGLLISFTILGR